MDWLPLALKSQPHLPPPHVTEQDSTDTLADVLAANSVLKELNVASNLDGESEKWTKTNGPAFAQELANGVSANGALTSLDISNNNIGQLSRGKL